MDLTCSYILNVGPHKIIDFKPFPGYYLPRVVLDPKDTYLCSLTALECLETNHETCEIYKKNKERMLENKVKKK